MNANLARAFAEVDEALERVRTDVTIGAVDRALERLRALDDAVAALRRELGDRDVILFEIGDRKIRIPGSLGVEPGEYEALIVIERPR